MISRKKILCLLDAFLMLCLLAGLMGCSSKSVESQPQKNMENVSEKNEEVSQEDYIKVLSAGNCYDTKEIKRLFLFGKALPDSLCVMDEDKHKVMSIVVLPYGTVEDKILGVADFSSLRKAGKYIVYDEENYQEQLISFSVVNGWFIDRIEELVCESRKNPTDYESLVISESYRLFPEAFKEELEATEADKPSIDSTTIEFDTIDNFWNCLEYINSTEVIDLDVASELMTGIIRNSEEILAKYKDEHPFFTVPPETQEVILEDMARLSVIDKIIPAHEYYKVISKEISFLRGLNSENLAIDLSNPRNRANMILVFSHLATKEDSINELYAQEN